MKKFIATLALVLMVTTYCYAVNPVDTVLCKKVFLRAVNAKVLVNRVTGEVKYILVNNRRWQLLRGATKNNLQLIYNQQVRRKH